MKTKLEITKDFGSFYVQRTCTNDEYEFTDFYSGYDGPYAFGPQDKAKVFKSERLAKKGLKNAQRFVDRIYASNDKMSLEGEKS